MTDEIFQVVDYTQDEIFFTLGTFYSFESAIQAIEDKESQNQAVSDNDDFEKIVILKNKIGWTGHGVRVFEINREYCYQDSEENETGIRVWKRCKK